MTREYRPCWKNDPALYSARCERIRRRREERLDRVADRLFIGTVVLFVWAASVALVLNWR